MSLIKHIDKVFKLKKEKGWKYIYIVVDVHGTILKPSHSTSESLFEFYPFAIESLQKLSKREDVCLIMHTSSYEYKIKKYDEIFSDLGIKFKYINFNPEIKSNEFACFNEKFFLDIGIDDKYGFDANTEWKEIFDYLEKLEE